MIRFHLVKQILASAGSLPLEMEGTFQTGKLTALFGPSGCGKSTLLKLIAGLKKPEKGYIKVDEVFWYDFQKKINISPQTREIGFVFQDFGLFPNMTVLENIIYALPSYKPISKATELLEMVNLAGFAKRHPYSLSGGQKQRVALARALARNPKLLLLDEPFSALDLETRFEIQEALLKFHLDHKLTTILVSHNREEIIKMADQVYLLHNGRVIQQGPPKEVFIPIT